MSHTPSQTELAWAAGFFDGEGCTYFRYMKTRKDGSKYYYPAFAVGQANDEPLNRLAKTFPFGHMTGPYRPYARSKKMHWKFYLWGFQHVQAAIAMMWPWLTEVKRKQATKVLLAVRGIAYV